MVFVGVVDVVVLVLAAVVTLQPIRASFVASLTSVCAFRVKRWTHACLFDWSSLRRREHGVRSAEKERE